MDIRGLVSLVREVTREDEQVWQRIDRKEMIHDAPKLDVVDVFTIGAEVKV
jgi:hypothetical protein